MQKNMEPYRFPIVIERDADGYFVSCPVLRGCYSQGETYEEALRNINDAIRLHIDDIRAEGGSIPKFGVVSLETIEIAA